MQNLNLNNRIYLDNSATTMVSKRSLDALIDAASNHFGNPSSLHKMGIDASVIVDDARRIIANSLSCDPSCITFTSGGTEANNIAIFGTANALKRRGNRIITTKTEHSSVLEPFKQLEKQGFDVVYLNVDNNGNLDLNEVMNAVNEQTILLSTMLVNNETGAIYPISKIASFAKRKNKNIVVHCDAVQAFCKIPINVNTLGVDLLSASGHKIHAPKGIGFLYKAKQTRIVPSYFGGGQEKGIRPGTESVPLISALSQAVLEYTEQKDEIVNHIKELNDYARKVLSEIDGVVIHNMEYSIPNILNVSALGVRSETMLHFLASKNIFVSGGSACSKGAKSHVLASMNFLDKEIESALRISFCKYNTKEDIDLFAQALKEGLETLVKAR